MGVDSFRCLLGNVGVASYMYRIHKILKELRDEADRTVVYRGCGQFERLLQSSCLGDVVEPVCGGLVHRENAGVVAGDRATRRRSDCQVHGNHHGAATSVRTGEEHHSIVSNIFREREI